MVSIIQKSYFLLVTFFRTGAVIYSYTVIYVYVCLSRKQLYIKFCYDCLFNKMFRIRKKDLALIFQISLSITSYYQNVRILRAVLTKQPYFALINDSESESLAGEKSMIVNFIYLYRAHASSRLRLRLRRPYRTTPHHRDPSRDE